MRELGRNLRLEQFRQIKVEAAKKELNQDPTFYSTDLSGLPFDAMITTAVQSRGKNPFGRSLGGLRVSTDSDPRKLAGDLSYAMTDKWVALEQVLKQSGATPDEIKAANMGGGKSVLSVPRVQDYEALTDEQRKHLFIQIGSFMERVVNGDHITAVDMGTKSSDMDIVSEVTKHVACQSVERGGTGNPSPTTAHGVWTAAKTLMGGMDIDPEKAVYGVQGVGEVGGSLITDGILKDFPNARIIIADKYEKAEEFKKKNEGNIQSVDPVLFWNMPTDVMMPCATAGVLDGMALREMRRRGRVKLICGSTNDQFPTVNGRADMNVVEAYYDKEIVVAPDSLVNMGGILHIALGWADGNRDEKGIVIEEKLNKRAMELVEKIGPVVKELYHQSQILRIPMEEAYRTFLENAYAENRLGGVR